MSERIVPCPDCALAGTKRAIIGRLGELRADTLALRLGMQEVGDLAGADELWRVAEALRELSEKATPT